MSSCVRVVLDYWCIVVLFNCRRDVLLYSASVVVLFCCVVVSLYC